MHTQFVYLAQLFKHYSPINALKSGCNPKLSAHFAGAVQEMVTNVPPFLVTRAISRVTRLASRSPASVPLAERNNFQPFHYVQRQAFFGWLALVTMIAVSMMSPVMVRRLGTLGFLGARLPRAKLGEGRFELLNPPAIGFQVPGRFLPSGLGTGSISSKLAPPLLLRAQRLLEASNLRPQAIETLLNAIDVLSEGLPTHPGLL